MLGTASPIPLDFLVDGSFVRGSLEEALSAAGMSVETTVVLQYVRALAPPAFEAAFEHDDWVGAVDVLSATALAGSTAAAGVGIVQERILTGSYDGLLRTWDSSGRVVATSPAGVGMPSSSIRAARFLSPKQVASSGYDGVVRIWNYAEKGEAADGSFKPALELFGHSNTVETIAVDGKARRLLTASWDGRVGLWATSKDGAPDVDEALLASANAAASSTKRRKLAAAPGSVPQRGPLALMALHSEPASAAVFHPGDDTVGYSASHDHSLRTLDLTTQRVVSTVTLSHSLLSLCALPASAASPLSAAGALLAAGTSARHVAVVDPRVAAAASTVLTLRGHRNAVVSLAAAPAATVPAPALVSASHDGTCRVWDLRSVRRGTRDEGGGSVSEAVYVIEREGGGDKAGKKGKASLGPGPIPGEGCKVFGVVWDERWGIVSGGEDKRVQINRGKDIVAS